MRFYKCSITRRPRKVKSKVTSYDSHLAHKNAKTRLFRARVPAAAEKARSGFPNEDRGKRQGIDFTEKKIRACSSFPPTAGGENVKTTDFGEKNVRLVGNTPNILPFENKPRP